MTQLHLPPRCDFNGFRTREGFGLQSYICSFLLKLQSRSTSLVPVVTIKVVLLRLEDGLVLWQVTNKPAPWGLRQKTHLVSLQIKAPTVLGGEASPRFNRWMHVTRVTWPRAGGRRSVLPPRALQRWPAPQALWKLNTLSPQDPFEPACLPFTKNFVYF